MHKFFLQVHAPIDPLPMGAFAPMAPSTSAPMIISNYGLLVRKTVRDQALFSVHMHGRLTGTEAIFRPYGRKTAPGCCYLPSVWTEDRASRRYFPSRN